MSARIRGASTELQELGEEEDQYTKSTSKMRKQIKAMTGFDIMKDEAGTQFKDIYDIVVGIGEQWDHLNDITRASLLEMIGGKRGVNSLAAVMNNIDRLKDIYQTAQGSQGSAEKEEEAYERSVQYSIDVAKARIQALVTDFLSSDLLKGIIDMGSHLLEIVDNLVEKLGMAKTILLGMSAASLFKGAVLGQDTFMGGILNDLAKIGRKNALSGVASSVANAFFGGSLDNAASILGSQTNGISEAATVLSNIDGLTTDDKLSLIGTAFDGVEKSAAATAISAANAGNALGMSMLDKLLAKLGRFGNAIKGIGAIIKGLVVANPVAFGIGVATAGLATYIAFKKKEAEATRQQGIESAKSWEQSRSSLEDYIKQYQKLKEDLGKATTDEEALSIKTQILDLQKQIVAEYSNQAQGIDLVNGSLERQLEILDGIAEKTAKKNLREKSDSYNQAFNATDVDTYFLGSYLSPEVLKSSDLGESVSQIIKKASEYVQVDDESGVISINPDIDYETALEEIGNVKDALNTAINDAINALPEEEREAAKTSPLVESLHQFIQDLTRWDEEYIGDAAEKYGETANAGIEEILYAVGGSKTIRKLEEASSNMMDAALGSDPKAFDEAFKNWEKYKAEYDDLVSRAVADYGEQFPGLSEASFMGYKNQKMSALEQSALDDFYRRELFTESENKRFSESNPYKNNIAAIQQYADKIKEAGLDLVDVETEFNKIATIEQGMNMGAASGFNFQFSETQESLLQLASALGYTKDQYADFITFLGSSGLVLSSTESATDKLTDSFNSTKSDIEKAINTLSGANSEDDIMNLQEILTEGISSTGMSEKALTSFKSIFGDKADRALERTAHGLKLNRDAFNELQRDYTNSKLSEFNDELKNQKDALEDVNQQLKETPASGNKAALEAQKENIENHIDELENLITMYEGATSAYNQWLQAQSQGQQRDMYESMYGAYDDYKKELLDNKWADDELRAWLEMMTGMKDASLMTYSEIVKAFNNMEKDLEGSSHSLMDFYTESDGSVTSEGIQNFLEAVHESFGNDFAKYSDEEGWTVDFSEPHIQAIMDKWTIGEELIQAIITAMGDAWDINGVTGEVSPEKRAYDAKSYLQHHTGADYKFSEIDVSALEGDTEAIQNAIELTSKYLEEFGTQDKEGYKAATQFLSYLKSISEEDAAEVKSRKDRTSREEERFQQDYIKPIEDARSYLQHNTGAEYEFSKIDLGSLDGNIDAIEEAITTTQKYIDDFGDTDPSGAQAAEKLMSYLTSLKESYDALDDDVEDHTRNQKLSREERRFQEDSSKVDRDNKSVEERLVSGLGEAYNAFLEGAGKIEEAASSVVTAIGELVHPNGEQDTGETYESTVEGEIRKQKEHNSEVNKSAEEMLQNIQNAREERQNAAMERVKKAQQRRAEKELALEKQRQKDAEEEARIEKQTKQAREQLGKTGDLTKYTAPDEHGDNVNADTVELNANNVDGEPTLFDEIGSVIGSAVSDYINMVFGSNKPEEEGGGTQASNEGTGTDENGNPYDLSDATLETDNLDVEAGGITYEEPIGPQPQSPTPEYKKEQYPTGTWDETGQYQSWDKDTNKDVEGYSEAIEETGEVASDSSVELQEYNEAMESAVPHLADEGAEERLHGGQRNRVVWGSEGTLGSQNPGAARPVQQAIQVNEQTQTIKVVADTQEAQKGVRQLAQDLQSLDGETQAELGINTEEAQATIEQISNLTDAEIEAGITISEEDLAVITNAVNSMSDEMKVALGIDSTEVDTYVAESHDANGIVHYGVDSSVVDSYSPPTKYGSVHYSVGVDDWSPLTIPESYQNQVIHFRYQADNAPAGGQGGPYNGTAHAGGSWGVKNDQDTMINELGEEIIVRDGRWFTVNNGYPAFTHLKRDDIVFNHKQTEQLLKNGYVTGSHGKFVGRSRAGGQNNDFEKIGEEIARGIVEGMRLKGEPTPWDHGGSTGDTSSDDDNNTTRGSDDGDNTGGGNTGGGGDDSKDKEKIDWIEVLLERLSETLEELKRAAERMDKYTDKIAKLNEAIEQVKNNISQNQQAYNKYMAQAEKVRKDNSGTLTADIINKIQNGDLVIEEYDEKTREKISEYQEWYDKARAVKDTIEDLNDELAELAQQKLDAVVDYFDSFTNLYDSYANRSNAINEYYQALRGWGNEASLDRMSHEQKRKIKDLQREYNAYKAEYDAQIASGQIVRGSAADNEAKARMQEILTAITEARTELININEQVTQIAMDRLAATTETMEAEDAYHNATMSRWQAENELYVQRHGRGNTFMLQQAGMAQVDQLHTLQREYQAYQRVFNESVANGQIEKDSKEYYAGLQKLEEYKAAIANAKQGVLDLNEAIRKANWANWEQGIATLEHIQNTISSISGLISDFNTFEPDSFALTDYGAAQLSAYSAEMLEARKEVGEYAAAMNRLNEEYKNGEITYADYTEQYRENYEKELAAAQKVQSSRKSILDTVRKGIEAETQAMSNLISKRKEALQRQKDADDYARTVSDKTKDINKIRQQIAALSGDTTQASQAKIRQLQAELAEKEEDLEDTRREHEYSVQQQALDDQLEVFKESQDKRTEMLSSNMDYQNEVIKDALRAATSDVGEIKDVWTELAEELGITIPAILEDRNPRAVANESQNVQDSNTHFGGAQQTDEAYKQREEERKARAQMEYNIARGNAEVAAQRVQEAKENMTNAGKELTSAQLAYRLAYTYVVNQDNTPMRSKANGGKVIMKLRAGTEVLYTGTKSGNYYKVQYKKKTGWIHAKYLDPTTSVAQRKKAKQRLDSAQARYNTYKTDYNEAVTLYNDAKQRRDEWAKEGAVKYKTTTEAALRKTADGKAALVAKIAKGATVEYLNESNGWWRKVTYIDPKTKKKKTGWIHAKNLQRLASGTKSARAGLALTDEYGLGTEAILTNKGTFRQLNAGDMVFNKAQKENLWKLSKLDVSAMLGNIKDATPVMNITQTYGSLLTVNGDVDKEALPELKTILNMAVAQTKKELADTMVRNGFAKR